MPATRILSARAATPPHYLHLCALSLLSRDQERGGRPLLTIFCFLLPVASRRAASQKRATTCRRVTSPVPVPGRPTYGGVVPRPLIGPGWALALSQGPPAYGPYAGKGGVQEWGGGGHPPCPHRHGQWWVTPPPAKKEQRHAHGRNTKRTRSADCEGGTNQWWDTPTG